MQNLHLPLNEPVLLFLPSTATGLELSCVTRVTIETEGRTSNLSTLVDFFLAQEEISCLVAKVITAHIHEPLPASSVLFQGDKYTLVAEVGKWEYGQRLELKWGNQHVVPCEDKWIFQFRAI